MMELTNENQLTLCLVSISVTIGQTIPAMVPTPLDIPINMLA